MLVLTKIFARTTSHADLIKIKASTTIFSDENNAKAIAVMTDDYKATHRELKKCLSEDDEITKSNINDTHAEILVLFEDDEAERIEWNIENKTIEE